MTTLHDRVATVIERVNKRSHASRSAYLEDIEAMETAPDSDRRGLACSNLAHAAAGAGEDQQTVLGTAAGTDDPSVNIGIITAGRPALFAVCCGLIHSRAIGIYNQTQSLIKLCCFVFNINI